MSTLQLGDKSASDQAVGWWQLQVSCPLEGTVGSTEVGQPRERRDTLASSPDGLSEACQMAVTATCPSLRTVTMCKQTITLICDCCIMCVQNVCVCAHDHSEPTEWMFLMGSISIRHIRTEVCTFVSLSCREIWRQWENWHVSEQYNYKHLQSR